MFSIDMLPAKQGDCLWVEYGSASNPSRVLIDGGVVSTYDILRERILALPEADREIELVVVTHVDKDHIEGMIKLFNDKNLKLKIGDVWYNGWHHIAPPDRLGALQGEFLSALIKDRRLPWNKNFKKKRIVIGDDDLPVVTLPGGMKITLLAPTTDGLQSMQSVWEKEVLKKKIQPGDSEAALRYMIDKRPEYQPPDLLGERKLNVKKLAGTEFEDDTSSANASCIAFLAEFEGQSCLFSGDAYATALETSLQRILEASEKDKLKIDALKVSHHGGRHNLSLSLLQLLDCSRYLFSTDGSYYHHPDRESIARVLCAGGTKPTLCFNYRSEENLIWNKTSLMREHKYKVEYPAQNEEGLLIEI
jgi:hypothetical protein